ncbi:hypothetical protein BH23PLA1_BH23PLA1_33810 [soil metagenome]
MKINTAKGFEGHSAHGDRVSGKTTIYRDSSGPGKPASPDDRRIAKSLIPGPDVPEDFPKFASQVVGLSPDRKIRGHARQEPQGGQGGVSQHRHPRRQTGTRAPLAILFPPAILDLMQPILHRPVAADQGQQGGKGVAHSPSDWPESTTVGLTPWPPRVIVTRSVREDGEAEDEPRSRFEWRRSPSAKPLGEPTASLLKRSQS